MSITLDDLPPDLKLLVEREVAADEAILWVGRPDVRNCMWGAARANWNALIVFAMFLGICLYVGAANHGIAVFLLVVLALVVLYIVLQIDTARSVYRRAKTTVYVVTAQRALALCATGRSASVQSVDRSMFSILGWQEGADGNGDLYFRASESEGNQSVALTFQCIPRVKDAYDLVRGLAAPYSKEEV